MTHSAFELLAEPIQHCLWRMGWTELRPIQSDSIRAVLQLDNDMIISAATASGKTEAAFLPIISHLVNSPKNSIGALYVSPLKALINDQFRRLDELCEYAELPVHRWHGDVGQSAKAKLVDDPQGILLTTPESLESLFVNRSSSLARMFSNLEFVVIDELHAFVGTERGTHLRSLLHRLEQKIGRKFRIFALSATLGEWSQDYATWIRPGNGQDVTIIADVQNAKTVRLKIYGYTVGIPDQEDSEPLDDDSPDTRDIVNDMLKSFKGRKGLIFANKKNDVEYFADALNDRCRREQIPESFLVHHGSLSKEIREDTEVSMRGDIPLTTLCSSTLELGIDIGNVEVVGQIGAPWSVSSMIQRLGRSGRRDEQASEMRVFIEKPPLGKNASLIDRLHPELLQAIALTELMLEKCLEPPNIDCFDPSSFVQQILSVLAETGGLNAADIYSRLAQQGTFCNISKSEYAELLRRLGEKELIEQTAEGDIILGLVGERIVKSFEFYSVFMSSKEFSVKDASRIIGFISAIDPPPPGEHLILAGRRWQVIDVDFNREEINVMPAHGRKPAKFRGAGGNIHDSVRAKMKEIVLGSKVIPYLNPVASAWLGEARQAAAQASLGKMSWYEMSSNSCVLFTWMGTKKQRALTLFALHIGLQAVDNGIAIEFRGSVPTVREKLISALKADDAADSLVDELEPQKCRKYDEYLSEALLKKSFVENAIEISVLNDLFSKIC